MEMILERLQGLILFTAGLLTLGLLAYKTLKDRLEEPGRTIGKWVLTGSIGYTYFAFLKPMSAAGGPSALTALLLALLVGLILAIIWTPPFLNFITRPIMDLFVGGWFADESRPFHALAKGLRKRGEFEKAIDEIDKQLGRFPDDMAGRLLKAEILAEDVGDIDSAAEVIDDVVESAESNPETDADALTKLADWRLRLDGDPEQAEAALQRLVGLHPESKIAARAQKMLKRLPDRERLKANPSLSSILQPGRPVQRIRVNAKAVARPDAVGKQAAPEKASVKTMQTAEERRKED